MFHGFPLVVQFIGKFTYAITRFGCAIVYRKLPAALQNSAYTGVLVQYSPELAAGIDRNTYSRLSTSRRPMSTPRPDATVCFAAV
jgi:hypothetical protein